jgi:hypothetical protein
MEIELKDKKVNCKNPTGREVKLGMKLLFEAQKYQDDTIKGLDKFEEFFDYVEKMASQGTGLSIDELDDLDTDDKNKIIEFYTKKINSRFDFLKSSLMQEN